MYAKEKQLTEEKKIKAMENLKKQIREREQQKEKQKKGR
jgi:hypothetical protein